MILDPGDGDLRILSIRARELEAELSGDDDDCLDHPASGSPAAHRIHVRRRLPLEERLPRPLTVSIREAERAAGSAGAPGTSRPFRSSAPSA